MSDSEHFHDNHASPDSEQSVGWAWLAALVNPFFLFQAFTEVFTSWLFTRPWRRLSLFLPAIVIVGATIGLIGYGATLSRATLKERYADFATDEMERIKSEEQPDQANESADDQLMKKELTSAFSDMLYRRLMQLDDQNATTRYRVALQLAHGGRLTQARQLMQEIAPPGERGFAPAHTWLAIDMLSRSPKKEGDGAQPLNEKEQAVLMSHLSQAVGWEGSGSALLVIYADLLMRQGKQQQALDVMAKAVQKNPRLRGSLAMMAKGRNKKLAEETTVDAVKSLKATIDAGKATAETYVELTALQLADENYKTALETARTGLNTVGRDNDRLKMLCSEALRLMYRQSIRKTDKGIELNLGLLDAAMKEYPSNPNLSVEIAMLTDMGVEAPPALKALMEEQLANGHATALAHLLLANQQLKEGRLAEAIPHLELSLKQAPNHPITLNNLALALALTDDSQFERAEELIDKAISVNPGNAEFYDSQGEIRLLAGRPLDAIDSLEKAIGIDPSRRHTHELMVKAYRAAGSEDMAVVHEKFLAVNKPVSKKDSASEDKPEPTGDAASKSDEQPPAP